MRSAEFMGYSDPFDQQVRPLSGIEDFSADCDLSDGQTVLAAWDLDQRWFAEAFLLTDAQSGDQ